MAPFPWRRQPAEPPASFEPTDEPAAGWDAITAVFAAAYPGQEPTHYGAVLPRRLGGTDPLDGISIYRASHPVPHWHYVTYGYSNLYDDDAPFSVRAGDSGLGMEMTLRLEDPNALDPSAAAPVWVVNLLQNLARHVFATGTAIRARHHLDAGGPIALDEPTQLTALAFLDDPISPAVQTPNGSVGFVQAVGITAQELADILAWNTEGVLSVIGQRWPFGLTVLDRPGLDDFADLRAQVRAGASGAGPSASSLAIQELEVTPTGASLTVELSPAALGEVFAVAEPALRAGNPLLLCGPDCSLELVPQGTADPPERRAPSDSKPGRIGLTTYGLRALGQLRFQSAGDYRHHLIPGVTWRLTGAEQD